MDSILKRSIEAKSWEVCEHDNYAYGVCSKCGVVYCFDCGIYQNDMGDFRCPNCGEES